MKYGIKYSKKFKKFFTKRTIKEQKNIQDKLILLQENPLNHNSLDIVKLIGFQNIYRLRINDYRIIYEVFENEIMIYVFNIGNRGDIYK